MWERFSTTIVCLNQDSQDYPHHALPRMIRCGWETAPTVVGEMIRSGAVGKPNLPTSRASEDDPVRLGNHTYRGWGNDQIRCGWETEPIWLGVGGVLSQYWF